MKKAEVKIGGVYYAKVTNRKVEIRIDAEKPRGGWEATNLATGKKITIKSAQRLQGEVGAKSAKTAETVASAEETTSPPKAVLKKPRKAKSAEGTSDKKLSCVAAALQVLAESIEPLNAKEMIEAMESQGLWQSPGGKTPHATLYSAILRDLSKGDESRFVKTERGRFVARN